MRRELHAFVQTRLTDFSDCRTAADMELTSIGALKTLLSEMLLMAQEHRETRCEVRQILESLSQLRNSSHSSLSNSDAAQTGETRNRQPFDDVVSEPSKADLTTESVCPNLNLDTTPQELEGEKFIFVLSQIACAA